MRAADPDSPEIPILNRDIYRDINEHRKNKWRENVNKVNKSCSSDLYRLIKNLEGKSVAGSNQAIKFKGR